MNKIDFANIGGADVSQGVLDYMQTATLEALSAIAKLCGSKTILYGVEVTGSVVSDGWIAYNGELIRFAGGTTGDKVVIVTEPTDRLYADNVMKPMLISNYATCGSVGLFDFADLVRLPQLVNMWLPGDVKTVHCSDAYIAANFDSTGLGINERAGWAVCNGDNDTQDMGGRVMIGFSTLDVDPGGDVWDIIYNTMLSTGGEKSHVLTIGELPSHNHTLDNHILTEGLGGSGLGGSTPGSSDPVLGTGYTGSNDAHENRQPFKVTLFIQKV